jgi:hypothetical protein
LDFLHLDGLLLLQVDLEGLPSAVVELEGHDEKEECKGQTNLNKKPVPLPKVCPVFFAYGHR